MHPNTKLDLNGKRFGKLVVFGLSTVDPNKGAIWKCKCDCGNVHEVPRSQLINGNTKSCGCLKFPWAGLSKTNRRLFSCWHEMLRRCYDPKRPAYAAYGAIGIIVCEFLRASPISLMSLLGDRPKGDSSIDRIDNSGSYTCGVCAQCVSKQWPLNVRWADRFTQSRNRDFVHRLTINGITKTPPEWAVDSGIPYRTIKSRMMRGWPTHRLLIPLIPHGKKVLRQFLKEQ